MFFKKIKKGHIEWQDLLCSVPASDYVFQKEAYEEQIKHAAKHNHLDFYRYVNDVPI